MPIATIQISRSALLHNASALKDLAPHAQLVAVVKGNAYGHGMKEVVDVLDRAATWFQVDDVEELAALRQFSNKATLVLGYVPREDLEAAVNLDAALGIYDCERLEFLAGAARRVGKPARVHIKIDTLLGRQGVLPDEIDGFVEQLQRYPEIEVEGVYTHFANIEDTTDFAHGQAQVDLFEEAIGRLHRLGLKPRFRHIASTSGLLVYEHRAKASDLFRAGIGLYGLYPSEALERSFSGLGLKPVMRWSTQLAQVKTLPPGHPVGYGLTFVTWRPTKIGIVPQGYADGYDRGLSNSGHVLVHGTRCPVVGRIAMNMFAVDLSGVEGAAQGDEVVLLGSQGSQTISAEELARRIGTINYEVVTRVSPLLRRQTTD